MKRTQSTALLVVGLLSLAFGTPTLAGVPKVALAEDFTGIW